jgi:hypothetical protein
VSGNCKNGKRLVIGFVVIALGTEYNGLLSAARGNWGLKVSNLQVSPADVKPVLAVRYFLFFLALFFDSAVFLLFFKVLLVLLIVGVISIAVVNIVKSPTDCICLNPFPKSLVRPSNTIRNPSLVEIFFK